MRPDEHTRFCYMPQGPCHFLTCSCQCHDTELTAYATGPANPVVAYCAPCLKNYVSRLLETSGEQVREIVEHPYMTGRTDVILTTGWDWTGTRA